MTIPNGVRRVFDISKIEPNDPGEAHLLTAMLEEGKAYLRSQRWCNDVSEALLGGGVGGVIAVFLMRLDEKRATGVDE
jgi:hypothetical protein